MNASRNKILIWAVIILMLANVALLATIWINHGKQKQPTKGTPADYLVKELALNTDQENKLRELAKQHHEASEKIRGQIKDARHQLFTLLKQPAVADSAKNEAAANVAKYLEQLDLLTFDHFQQVRALCNPQQQKRFDDIIEDVLQMIASGPPPPPRPPRDGGHLPPGDQRPPPEQ